MMKTIRYKGHSLYRWEVGASTFLACPEIGARLMNWYLAFPDGSTRDVIHWPSEADFSNFARVRGGNPILFPFAGRCYDKGAIGFWRAQDNIRRPMPIHGFALKGNFHLAEAHDHGFKATFEPTEGNFAVYPYDYEFSVTYYLSELSIGVDLKLVNREKYSIPWSPGHHFYFVLPWQEGLKRSDYRIHIPAKKAFRHAADGQLEPVKKCSNSDTFDNPELCDRIHTALEHQEITFGPEGGKEEIRLRMGSQKTPSLSNAVVTWTENKESPFYCVEPWMGAPNSPEHKLGLHFVEPGETGVFSVAICLA